MKKTVFFIVLLSLVSLTVFAQNKKFEGKVFDGINFMPVEGASIYNTCKRTFVFTKEDGSFSIDCKINDTLIISKSIYRQIIVVLDEKMILKGREDFLLYYKAILLREVNVIALNPTYEGFKRDLSKIEIPDAYKRIKGTEISDVDKANAYYGSGPNLFKYAPEIAHPISYLYSKYNRKCKNKRLYYEMMQYEDRLDEVPLKYNKQLVMDLTGLPEEEVLNFMMYCHFSYYDLVRWSPVQVSENIKQKYFSYEYEKLNKQKK